MVQNNLQATEHCTRPHLHHSHNYRLVYVLTIYFELIFIILVLALRFISRFCFFPFFKTIMIIIFKVWISLITPKNINDFSSETKLCWISSEQIIFQISLIESCILSNVQKYSMNKPIYTNEVAGNSWAIYTHFWLGLVIWPLNVADEIHKSWLYSVRLLLSSDGFYFFLLLCYILSLTPNKKCMNLIKELL